MLQVLFTDLPVGALLPADLSVGALLPAPPLGAHLPDPHFSPLPGSATKVK